MGRGRGGPLAEAGRCARPPPPSEETAASPEDFEGSATEVEDDGERPGRRDNRRKRKRKAR